MNSLKAVSSVIFVPAPDEGSPDMMPVIETRCPLCGTVVRKVFPPSLTVLEAVSVAADALAGHLQGCGLAVVADFPGKRVYISAQHQVNVTDNGNKDGFEVHQLY